MIIYNRSTREKLFEIPGDTLVGKDLRLFNLRYADLTDLDLTLCNFGGMDLEGAEFSRSTMVEANMIGCNLPEAIFARTDLSDARLAGSKMLITAFSYAIMHGADFSEIIIEGMVNFRWIKAHDAKFKNIKNFSGANFFEADLTNSDFEGSDFTQVSESDRTGTILTGTLFEHLMYL